MSGVGTSKITPPVDAARGPALAGIAALAVFFIGLGGWAALAPLNGAVVAPAVIKVEGNRKTIQHLDGGIVSQILVKDGSRVVAGETLLVLEPTQAQAALDVLSLQHKALLAQERRLLAERDGLEAIEFTHALLTDPSPAVRQMVVTEARQFDVRRTVLNGKLSVLRQRIEQLQEEVRGAQAQLLSAQQRLELTQLELEAQYELFGKELTTRSRILALERDAAALRGQQGEIEGSMAKSRQAVGEIELSIIQVHNETLADVARELRETEIKIADLVPRLRAADDVLERTRIRSPYAGQIVDLSVFSVGAVIQRGERVMDIVPKGSGLVAEVSISVEDIQEVQPGQRAEIRPSGYQQRSLPTLHGKIVEVAADRLTDRRTGAPYYTALVLIDDAEFAETPEIVLQPGMSATVMIPTVERTALGYLGGPFTAALNRSFRQR